MTINNADQLIILGNGFDLHCGLKTSFKDYFEFKEKEILSKLVKVNNTSDNKGLDDLYNEKIRLGYNLHYANDVIINSDIVTTNYGIKQQFQVFKNFDFSFLSFWDVYFINLKNEKKENWADVEFNIAEYLKHCIKKKDIILYIKGLNSSIFLKETFNRKINSMEDILVYFMLLTIDMEKIKGLNLKKFLCYLKDQLIDFEKNINDYILSLFVDDNPNSTYSYEGPFIEQLSFIDNFKETINKMIKENSSDEKYCILSFNYIFFPSERLEQKDDLKEMYLVRYIEDLPNCTFYKNIHGKLGKQNSNVIIGIDEKNIEPQDELYRFTKTYQLFEFDNDGNERNLGLPIGVKKIKFFGHSLAEADYSYFQSIFDFYDIYNTNVQLIFYYVNYKNSDGEEVDGKEELFLRVIRLMKEYGETLDNKDHGKNLLHKLRLENRIILKKLDEEK
ncbi:AbiH family protein [Ligilactobacillus aviarius]|uniref:AbiH family protein n=1 Tax=Ligilactobacillus aviarius TaxID=1606 RepID=UPI0038905C96